MSFDCSLSLTHSGDKVVFIALAVVIVAGWFRYGCLPKIVFSFVCLLALLSVKGKV